MTKNSIYQAFISEYPYFEKLVTDYKKNGKNSILVSTKNGKNLVYRVEGTKSSLTSY